MKVRHTALAFLAGLAVGWSLWSPPRRSGPPETPRPEIGRVVVLDDDGGRKEYAPRTVVSRPDGTSWVYARGEVRPHN